jgi:hypothetical protein
MADAGRFPEPVRLGKGKNGRLGFVEAEVLAWNAERVEERSRRAKPVDGGVGTDPLGGASLPRRRPKVNLCGAAERSRR